MTKIMELADKNDETTVINILHKLKKIEENMNLMRREIKM